MKTALFAAIAFSAAGASGALAQGGPYPAQCPPGSVDTFGIPDQQRASQDACVKAIDLFRYLVPQLGVALTGGNATLGQGSALGGPGHFSVGIRVNGVAGDLPQFDNSTNPGVSGAVASTYDTKSQLIGLPTADLGVGLFGGLPLGLTNVGAVDAIVSASYLPAFSSSSVDVKVPDGSLKLGFGARVGILQESLIVPGVSFTYLARSLPTVDITSNFQGDTLQITGLSEKTRAWRVVVSKSLLTFGVALGAGRDTYSSDATIRASVAPQPPATTQRYAAGPVALSQDVTRTNMFADFSFNLPLLKIVAEIGQVSGGKITTFNQFDGRAADASRLFGSVGARLGF